MKFTRRLILFLPVFVIVGVIYWTTRRHYSFHFLDGHAMLKHIPGYGSSRPTDVYSFPADFKQTADAIEAEVGNHFTWKGSWFDGKQWSFPDDGSHVGIILSPYETWLNSDRVTTERKSTTWVTLSISY
jgi:hypothetical protein